MAEMQLHALTTHGMEEWKKVLDDQDQKERQPSEETQRQTEN